MMPLVLALTACRLTAAVVFVALVDQISPLASASILGLALLTDLLDGWLARALHVETEFGRILDLVADKTLIAACLLFAASRGIALVPLALLVCRDLSTLGLRAMTTKKHSFPSSRTFGALVMLIIVLLASSILLFPSDRGLGPATNLAYWLVATVTTAELIHRYYKVRFDMEPKTTPQTAMEHI
jgi:phosphatidylglycerophosphate synthase